MFALLTNVSYLIINNNHIFNFNVPIIPIYIINYNIELLNSLEKLQRG